MPTIHQVSTAHNHDGVYAPIGSTGGVTVQDEGTPLTARGTINFTGDGVSAADDAVNERTNVTITGGVTDHGALTGLSDDDHPQYVKHSLATAVSDFLVASGAGAFVKKTLAEVKAILGLGSAAYTASTDYLAAGGKAADSDKLDNHDTSYFATADHNHSGVYPQADGWIPVSSTWTYASATTITVPSGAAAIYKVGQGIKLNNTDTKYFYIVGVADALLTITGGSDYTLDSDAISAVSYTNTPGTAIGFPDVFSYTSTPTAITIGSGTIAAKFSRKGKMCYGSIQVTLAANSSVTGTVYLSLPSTPAGAIRSPIAIVTYLDAGSAQYAGVGVVESATIRLKVFKSDSTYAIQSDLSSTVPFTWAVNDQIIVTFTYEAA